VNSARKCYSGVASPLTDAAASVGSAKPIISHTGQGRVIASRHRTSFIDAELDGSQSPIINTFDPSAIWGPSNQHIYRWISRGLGRARSVGQARQSLFIQNLTDCRTIVTSKCVPCGYDCRGVNRRSVYPLVCCSANEPQLLGVYPRRIDNEKVSRFADSCQRFIVEPAIAIGPNRIWRTIRNESGDILLL